MSYLLATDLTHLQQRINHFLAEKLKTTDSVGSPLVEAMAYAVLLGGKRVRPFLIYATGRMLGVPLEKLDHSAAAMEAIHAYSLVHDDLPAMDDDRLRRGKPTCHIAFDEATAILAGDALQSFAFELLATDPHLTDREKVAQVTELATASGAKGMCLGQSLDLIAENKAVSLEELELIHRNKTGALILSSVMMGLNLSEHSQNLAIKQPLVNYAKAIGLAFQVQDDILDVIGDTDKIGKTVGSDEHLNKSTYPKLLGLDGAKQKAEMLYQTALHSLEQLPFDTTALKELANFIVKREN
ncbi:TPA: (2E,6E)-farnesyl diphosphate synthase [Mannheimia haemolytica]|uniref:Farnesyl diphosphate synthase n=1 Tax=Mannheimia haemolytica TaxID=75985 RepID=A0A378NC13_MANHA|nr:(2E,6E)-farnesyl diphosphate synthase [Mannheimia haemolytica]AGQ39806.1 geranyltranstransferase [Mannheimia haemolytica D171]AJE07910.1 (2E,6E)-farnesyl diphosphate synthase [Mannheimia haemolytica USDA-ARS-USMARC-184]EEY09852.1 geranyltranstransferase [Mannheimia haemolytica serotype A2 str. OVINE]EEY13372.1 geranyltranstransferase [Mannheimia haemolytica serotype A2 str. BOVINE]KYL06698.1 geranyl transferase [Mannheimia haemolytica]